jgi:hypothetical protein
VLVAVNKDWRAPQPLPLPAGLIPAGSTLHRPCPGHPARALPAPPAELSLEPAEVALLELPAAF